MADNSDVTQGGGTAGDSNDNCFVFFFSLLRLYSELAIDFFTLLEGTPLMEGNPQDEAVDLAFLGLSFDNGCEGLG